MRLLLTYKTAAESPSFKTPSSFAVQGDVLARGLEEIGVEVKIVDRRDSIAKQKAYEQFKPEKVVGVGYWGDVPEIVVHPQEFGQKPVPWLVSDGAVLAYQKELNSLPLVLATSRYVKKTFSRDGVSTKIKVVYEGIDTTIFQPKSKESAEVSVWRERLGVRKGDLLILTIGGDGKSKGFEEMIKALKLLEGKFDNWKFVLKVASSETGQKQTVQDLKFAEDLGLREKVLFFSEMLDEAGTCKLINAADIYVSPSHNEGFCRPLVEAQACGIPVLTVNGTTTAEVVEDGVGGFAAKVKKLLYKREFDFNGKDITFDEPKVVGVEADSEDLAKHTLLLKDAYLREKLGKQGRDFAIKNFDYRKCAQDLVEAIS